MGVPLILSSVPNVSPYIQYVATSNQTVFPYPFPITQDADLIVVVNGVTLATDNGYTLSGQGQSNGGNVTFTLGQTAGTIVTLFRNIAIARITQIGQNSGYSSTTLNAEFNNFYLIAQQLQASIAQCLQIPNTNNPAPTTTLTLANYANKYLSFDGNGNPTPAALTTSGTVTQALILSFLTQANIAAILIPQTAAEAAALVVPTNLQYQELDIRRYGGDPTGAVTSDTALANAIAICSTTGGTIRLPGRGTIYKFANQWNLSQKRNITIQGDGGSSNGSNSATTVLYTGSTGPFIQDLSAFGCSVRGLYFQANNAAFTGFWLQSSNDGLGHGNSFFNSAEDCFFYGNNGSANCGGVTLDKNQSWYCRRCYFFLCAPCVAGQSAPAGGGFSINALFEGCEFTHANGSYCIGSLGYSWSLITNTFEVAPNGVLTAIQNGTTTPALGLCVHGNWFGDVSATSTIMSLSGQGIDIRGNFIGGDTLKTSVAINLTSATGVAIQANYFTSFNVLLTFGDANCAGVSFQFNSWPAATVNTPIGSYNINAPTLLQWAPNSPNIVPPAGATFGNPAANGFTVNPDGTIRMWGTKTVTQGTPLAIVFATEVGRAFPNNCWNGVGNAETAGYSVGVSSRSATGMTLTINGSAGSSTVDWEAIGN